MTSAREIVVATPNEGRDLYAVHQQVWDGASAWIASAAGQSFIYSPESPDPARRHSGLWRVRSRFLPTEGTSAALLPPSGTLRVDVVATRVHHGREVAIPEEDQAAWVTAVLQKNGLRPRNCRITSRWRAIGHKRSQGHRICLPAVRVAADFEITDLTAASNAFVSGIGRAKRFGFGMIRVTG